MIRSLSLLFVIFVAAASAEEVPRLGTIEAEKIVAPPSNVLLEKFQERPNLLGTFVKDALAVGPKELGLIIPTVGGSVKFSLNPNPPLKYILSLAETIKLESVTVNISWRI